GGINTIDPLERLSVVPSPKQPLLVELGVLQGGKRVLFAVQPGAAVSGPGTCTPGPIDCEVLTLAPGQTEGVSKQTSTGTTRVAPSGAQAIVVNDGGTPAGVALTPSTRGFALPAGVSAVTSAAACTDPWLSLDLGGPSMPNSGLCYRGGSVIHKNETFALTWD